MNPSAGHDPPRGFSYRLFDLLIVPRDSWYVAGNGRLCQNRAGAARPAGGDRPVVDRLGGAGGSGQHGVNQQLPPTFRQDVPPPAHQVNNL